MANQREDYRLKSLRDFKAGTPIGGGDGRRRLPVE